jgi:rod shape-determining protein MreC
VLRLDGDNAIAAPLADPASASFAIVQQPYEPEAMVVSSANDDELP